MTDEQFSLIEVVEDFCTAKGVAFKPMRVAADIMNADVKILTLDHTVKTFLEFMEVHKVRHAPVVDPPTEKGQKPYFVGIISERDALRQISPHGTKTSRKNQTPTELRKLLTQIVTRKPICALPQTPVPDLIASMLDNHIGIVPILADGNLVGIVTTTDIVKLFAMLETTIHRLCPQLKEQTQPVDESPDMQLLFSWLRETVQQIMTRRPICLKLNDTLGMAKNLMQREKFRHVLVINSEDKLAGIVSDRDILRYLPSGGWSSRLQSRMFRAQLFDVDSKAPSLDLPLAHIMTWDATHILPDCTVCDAAKKFRKKRVGCLPVLDGEKNLLGIVTVTDLMRTLLAAYQSNENHIS